MNEHKPVLHIYQDGDQFFAALPDFVNLQESEVVWLAECLWSELIFIRDGLKGNGPSATKPLSYGVYRDGHWYRLDNHLFSNSDPSAALKVCSRLNAKSGNDSLFEVRVMRDDGSPADFSDDEKDNTTLARATPGRLAGDGDGARL